jgi:putative transposase
MLRLGLIPHNGHRYSTATPRPASATRWPSTCELTWSFWSSLVIDALEMASRNYPLAAGAIFHSDRGTQYTSQAFANKTAELGIRRSVGRTGVCFDNAQAESCNAAVKVERVNRTVYPTREHARKDVARYIEFRYNRKRLHSALGYQTPEEAYNGYLNRQTAA